MDKHEIEVQEKKRFEFGRNWQSFLKKINQDRIREAEKSLMEYLNVGSLDGLEFLDVGSGSGLFSLAARNLGARVYSFDYDPKSVACTRELKKRYYPNDKLWVVEEGSILDDKYVSDLGQFDIVYSWGVLHHTGDMYKALENIMNLVKYDGILFISLYNHQDNWSKFYTLLKKKYNESSSAGRVVIGGSYICFQVCKGLIKDVLFLKNPLRRYHEKKEDRGMSVWVDWIDWIGGYPFETSKPEEIIDFFYREKFVLEKLKTCGGGHGCNEYVFRKSTARRFY